MSYYLDIHEGRINRKKKKSRVKKGYKEVSAGVWTKLDCDIEIAEESFPINKVFMWLNSSANSRSPDLLSLSLCNVSPKCPFPSLAKDRYACRIDMDLVYGSLLVWRLSYNEDEPDLIIEDALLIESIA